MNDQEWSYSPEESNPHAAHIEDITWTASEYISHEKSHSWYLSLAGTSAAIAILISVITREILPAFTFLVVAFSAGFFASRPPAQKTYTLTDDHLQIDDKILHYDSFKSFSIVEEGAIDSVWLKPMSRYKPFTILYFAPGDEAKITEALSHLLPHEERELDRIDKLSRYLRF